MRTVAALRKASDAALLKAAALAGAAVRSVPGAVGAGCVAWGAAQVYEPLGWIVAGVALLLIDKKVP